MINGESNFVNFVNLLLIMINCESNFVNYASLLLTMINGARLALPTTLRGKNNENLAHRCYKCHESGHIAKDCTKEDVCYVCNKVLPCFSKHQDWFNSKLTLSFPGRPPGQRLPGPGQEDLLPLLR